MYIYIYYMDVTYEHILYRCWYDTYILHIMPYIDVSYIYATCISTHIISYTYPSHISTHMISYTYPSHISTHIMPYIYVSIHTRITDINTHYITDINTPYITGIHTHYITYINTQYIIYINTHCIIYINTHYIMHRTHHTYTQHAYEMCVYAQHEILQRQLPPKLALCIAASARSLTCELFFFSEIVESHTAVTQGQSSQSVARRVVTTQESARTRNDH